MRGYPPRRQWTPQTDHIRQDSVRSQARQLSQITTTSRSGPRITHPLPVAVPADLVLVYPVDAHRDRDDERVVGARGHLHSVGVPDAEPLAGDLPDHPAVAGGERPVLVHKVAGRLELLTVGQIDE